MPRVAFLLSQQLLFSCHELHSPFCKTHFQKVLLSDPSKITEGFLLPQSAGSDLGPDDYAPEKQYKCRKVLFISTRQWAKFHLLNPLCSVMYKWSKEYDCSLLAIPVLQLFKYPYKQNTVLYFPSADKKKKELN